MFFELCCLRAIFSFLRSSYRFCLNQDLDLRVFWLSLHDFTFSQKLWQLVIVSAFRGISSDFEKHFVASPCPAGFVQVFLYPFFGNSAFISGNIRWCIVALDTSTDDFIMFFRSGFANTKSVTLWSFGEMFVFALGLLIQSRRMWWKISSTYVPLPSSISNRQINSPQKKVRAFMYGVIQSDMSLTVSSASVCGKKYAAMSKNDNFRNCILTEST